MLYLCATLWHMHTQCIRLLQHAQAQAGDTNQCTLQCNTSSAAWHVCPATLQTQMAGGAGYKTSPTAGPVQTCVISLCKDLRLFLLHHPFRCESGTLPTTARQSRLDGEQLFLVVFCSPFLCVPSSAASCSTSPTFHVVTEREQDAQVGGVGSQLHRGQLRACADP
jgi:hypothetical protein